MSASPFNPLLSAFGRVIDGIKINSISKEMRNGSEVWVKRRLPGRGLLIRCANFFFRLVRNPVRVWHGLEDWRRWEVLSFQILNGDKYQAFADSDRSICAERIPGTTLSDHLERGTITIEMYEAAAEELRNAHTLWCKEFNGPWSHGDSHLANMIYDEASGRARMIDFDVIHEKSLSPEERHADDLLIFLQDLVGRVPVEQWLTGAICFLSAYGRPEVIRILKLRLDVPGGVALLWWIVRANYLRPAELRRRIKALRLHIPDQAP